jgi:sugar-specific transcriptional regulator TrmB
LDGEPVMAMFRRSPKSPSALRRRQEEIEKREAELREKLEELQRSIAAAPRVAEETARRQREEVHMRAKTGGNRLDVSFALQDKRFGDDDGTRRHRPLRKERREGRMVFLLLVAALAVAVIWLMSHMHF